MVNHRDELARQIRNALAEQNDPDVPVVVLVQRLRAALAASEGREKALRDEVEQLRDEFILGNPRYAEWLEVLNALLSAPQPGEGER